MSNKIFLRMMYYINNDDLIQARTSVLSDISKIDKNPLNFPIIMSSKDNLELIKNVAGFCFMNEKIQKYYEDPEKAFRDYPKSETINLIIDKI